MPGLFRKIAIYAAAEGLILYAHGSSEQHRHLRIDYKTQKIVDHGKHDLPNTDGLQRLESYGLIGSLNVASTSYLIAITKREQVAQIFGQPVFVILDVALLPLGSQHAAQEAINAALNTHHNAGEISSSDHSDSEDETSHTSGTQPLPTPAEDTRPFQEKNSSSTSSIAEDVATRNVPFGRFATQWLSRQRWTPSRDVNKGENVENAAAETNEESSAETAKTALDNPPVTQDIETTSFPATTSLLPRILPTTKLIFTSRSYFFSYDFDLTQRLDKRVAEVRSLNVRALDPVYFWNRKLGSMFLDSGQESLLVPLIQGFVGQRTFTIANSGKAEAASAVVEEQHDDKATAEIASAETKSSRNFLLTVISRRSTRRSGLRYLRRGIDDDGYCANFVETEQLLSSEDWDPARTIRSFSQIRGSIPVYFSQSPYSFKPAVIFSNSPEANLRAFTKHFQLLKRDYGNIQISMLIDKHGTEKPAGEAYEKLYKQLRESGQGDGVDFEWFDFHAECRGMKFENVQRLVDEIQQFLEDSGETVLQTTGISKRQRGIVRTNCMDCLDRTNVTQSALAQWRLQRDLAEEGFEIDLVKDESTNWFNTLWADNGDAISRQYASTSALKGDYTRTRKRNWRGAVNDFGLTLSRYYSNMFNDYFAQTVIDVLLQNVSWKVFEDFESTMMSTDPGISVQSVRQAAIENCAKIVVQESHEDLIHGWTMMVPNQENTLRTLPFEEAVVLLTDAALYCCKMDWSTEKIARFEKVDLRSITKVRFGTYITTTFSERQMDEKVNQGVVITYKPGSQDMIRVNTRSLQNAITPEDSHSVDGGTGILSWLAPRASSTPSRIMALKVIHNSTADEAGDTLRRGQTPQQEAESIGDEIRRAMMGSGNDEGRAGQNLVEAGDIIGVDEAKRRTGYIEHVSQSIRKLVWA